MQEVRENADEVQGGRVSGTWAVADFPAGLLSVS